MKKNDFRVIGSLIICVIILFLIRLKPASNGAFSVIIRENGVIYGTYSLATDRVIALNNNTVVIKNSSVSVSDANCHDKLCIKSSAITSPGQSLVCLPNRLSVEIVDSTIAASTTTIKLGTAVSISIYTPLEDADLILNEALELIDYYESVFSSTLKESELYRLNNRLLPVDENGLYTISNDLYELINLGLEFSDESSGVFNIAIGAISSAWNFSSVSGPTLPSKEAIDSGLPYSHTDCIIIGSNSHIGFTNPSTRLDLGGIAKGYIGEKVKELLLARGVDNAIINLGGDSLCIGGPFRIGIQKPFSSLGDTSRIIESSNSTVVTSGTYERTFTVDDKIYHHLLDPATGFPFVTDIDSVTIIDEEGTRADYLATFLLSMGTKKALEYAKAHSIKAIIIDEDLNIVSSYY